MKIKVPLRCFKILSSHTFKVFVLCFGVVPILYSTFMHKNSFGNMLVKEDQTKLNHQLYNIFHKKYTVTSTNVNDSMDKIANIKVKVTESLKEIARVETKLVTRTQVTPAGSHQHVTPSSVKHPPVVTRKTRSNKSSDVLPECNTVPPDFKGRETVLHTVLTMDKLEYLHGEGMELGGRYRPTNCSKPYRVAIILPYRDRDPHFKIFLNTVIPKLKRQLTDFTIFRIEQEPGESFNRGMMRNVGFMEASKLREYDCYVFNDVDTIIEDDRNILRCDTKYVYHLISGVDRYRYKLMYFTLIGGIIGFTKPQFTKCNGYSNSFFVWGAEDDNMYTRLRRVGNYSIMRPNVKHGLVTTLKHTKDKVHMLRNKINEALENNTMLDGLNTLNYEVLKMQRYKLFTNFLIKVNQSYILTNLYRIAPELKDYPLSG